MGLRCTVFGHKWGDADTEREREEDGDEVVTTVREVRTCRRCGAEDVLGTSKEVTSLASAAESDPRSEAATTRDPEPGDDQEHHDPEADDGVILDENGDADGEGRTREWPNHPEDDDADEHDEPAPWPETAREPDDDQREERFVGADRRAEEPGPADEASGSVDGGPGSIDERRDPAGADADSGPDDAGTGGEGGEIIEAGDAGADAAVDGPADERTGGDEATGVAEAPGDDGVGTDDAEREVARGADEGRLEGTDEEELEDADGGEPGGGEREKARGADTGESGGASGGERGDGPPEENARASGPEQSNEDRSDAPHGVSDQQSGDGSEPGDEETMMGPDATRRPDDDAEVLESTEPNEQNRATAREPVDPTDHVPAGDPVPSEPDPSPSLDPGEPASDEDPAPEDVEYYCSECDYVDDSKWPSRRAGDVCPNCRRSYLSERRY